MQHLVEARNQNGLDGEQFSVQAVLDRAKGIDLLRTDTRTLSLREKLRQRRQQEAAGLIFAPSHHLHPSHDSSHHPIAPVHEKAMQAPIPIHNKEENAHRALMNHIKRIQQRRNIEVLVADSVFGNVYRYLEHIKDTLPITYLAVLQVSEQLEDKFSRATSNNSSKKRQYSQELLTLLQQFKLGIANIEMVLSPEEHDIMHGYLSGKITNDIALQKQFPPHKVERILSNARKKFEPSLKRQGIQRTGALSDTFKDVYDARALKKAITQEQLAGIFFLHRYYSSVRARDLYRFYARIGLTPELSALGMQAAHQVFSDKDYTLILSKPELKAELVMVNGIYTVNEAAHQRLCERLHPPEGYVQYSRNKDDSEKRKRIIKAARRGEIPILIRKHKRYIPKDIVEHDEV